MELVILGSGTYQPELKRHPASYLLKIGRQKLVFDFGRGALDQLLRLDIEYADIDQIFLTHLHPDHWEELIAFLHIALAEPLREMKRKKKLVIWGPAGFKKRMAALLKIFFLDKHLNEPRPLIEFRELKNGGIVAGAGWKVKAWQTEHSDISQLKSLAYRLEAGGKVWAYSGDVESEKGVIEAAQAADVAIIEASWPEKILKRGHLSALRAARIAQQAGAKKLILTHIAPSYLKAGNPKAEAAAVFTGPVLVAKDLMKVKI